MVIKRKKSAAMKFLEDITGGPLSLGKFLQSIRLGEELSQVEFAGQLGISKSHLCDIEKDASS
jgi:DNA-binding transcriptional regulator YiaG